MDCAPVRLVDGWLVYEQHEGWQPYDRAALGHEVAIRDLLKLEVHDDDEVLAFIAQHGVLTRQVRFLSPFDPAGLPDSERGDRVHLEDARLHLLTARCLARHWLADQFEEDVAPAWEELRDAHQLVSVPGDEEQMAWGSFASYLSTGLEAFHARMTFTHVFPSGYELEIARPHVTLYSALCHQLFNLYVEEAPVLRCAYESCRQPFVRQDGRAQHGQHRTRSLLYCSASCARRKANRDYRARERAKKGGAR